MSLTPSPNLEVHGAFPDWVIKSTSCDRFGIIEVIAEVEIASPSGEFPFNLAFITGGPNIGISVPCIGVTFGWTEGKYVFQYKYEGVQSGYTYDDRRTLYELDVNMRQEDIRTHPDFAAIQQIYGTYDADSGGFPIQSATDDGNNDSSIGTDPNSGDQIAISPVYGVTSYLLPQLIWRRTIVTATLSPNIYKALGCIDKPPSPTSGGPVLPDVQTWLKTDVRAAWRGNIWQITEEWSASGRYGWNKNIYRKIS